VDASALKQNAGVKEDNEDTEVLLIPAAELRKMLDGEEIINSHTLIAAQWFFLNPGRIRDELS
jgi:hypothetical protein